MMNEWPTLVRTGTPPCSRTANLDWTYVRPPAMIAPERAGRYRGGKGTRHERAGEFVDGKLGAGSPSARRRARLRRSRGSEALRLRSRRCCGLHGQGWHPAALPRGGGRDRRGAARRVGAHPWLGHSIGSGSPGVRHARGHPGREARRGLRGWLRVRAHATWRLPEPGAPGRRNCYSVFFHRRIKATVGTECSHLAHAGRSSAAGRRLVLAGLSVVGVGACRPGLHPHRSQ